MYQKRLESLHQHMSDQQIEAVYLCSDVNCYYFSGFTGSSRNIVISSKTNYFFTDFRYGDQAQQEVQEHEIKVVTPPLLNTVVETLSEQKAKKIGLEFSKLNTKDYLYLKEKLPDAEFINVDPFLSETRMIKDEVELSYIKKGMEIVDSTFTHILSYLKTGISEKELGLELEYTMKKLGADGIKENHVIATGARSSLPHGQATNKIIEHGDFVKMDIGAKVNGYYTDFTRTVVMGEATEEQLNMYSIVKEAQEASLAAIKAGKTCAELDNVGRSIIQKAGYGENFGHSLGHSLGLEIHEMPAMRSTDQTVLQPGMVLTVEPGIYVQNLGGVRIEDLVVVEENGINNLTTSTKELQIIQ
ncbi:M24 family metallopeptidase [Salinibacillus xinjiangensis]|uniref:M24 family metallopeptidase n=1 Tax=Salinibacillus xinjiangensis TaxID=1229268 RepID=A0A6G1XAS2_9BACI|nr:Xaa-Pro peptidase family protein [Salinibacillus xinjiangensis]MRG87888.1 M24 family metallopeptidase [Salinibacillus xinjiangensis]